MESERNLAQEVEDREILWRAEEVIRDRFPDRAHIADAVSCMADEVGRD